MRTLLLLSCAILGCGSGGGGGGPDMRAKDLSAGGGDMALLSRCGMPGDQPVNSLGVGKFCMTLAECMTDPNAKTNLCTILGNGSNPSPDDTYFCTIFPCQLDAGVAQCGDNATCVCGSAMGGSGCVCTPNKCIDMPDMK
jgi:hypothetical protein